MTLFSALAAFGTTTASVAHITAAPRAELAESIDPWQCLTENLTQYLDVPKPTDSLFKELQSHGSKLYKPCLAAPTLTAFCPFPVQSSWCAFTTSAPSDVLPVYSSYASQAYLWWSAHSSSVVSLAQECPIGWENAILMYPGGDMWLNNTIAFAGCYAEAHTTVGSSLTELTAATTRSGVDVGSGRPTPTTDALRSVLSRADPMMAIVIGLAAITASSI